MVGLVRFSIMHVYECSNVLLISYREHGGQKFVWWIPRIVFQGSSCRNISRARSGATCWCVVRISMKLQKLKNVLFHRTASCFEIASWNIYTNRSQKGTQNRFDLNVQYNRSVGYIKKISQ